MEALYNILIKFGVTMKLVRLFKMCLNETYNKVRTGKHFSDNFPIQNGLKQGGALSPLYMLLSRHQNEDQNHDIKTATRSFENVAQFRYLGTTVTKQNSGSN
jgi:hypothetical protein